MFFRFFMGWWVCVCWKLKEWRFYVMWVVDFLVSLCVCELACGSGVYSFCLGVYVLDRCFVIVVSWCFVLCGWCELFVFKVFMFVSRCGMFVLWLLMIACMDCSAFWMMSWHSCLYLYFLNFLYNYWVAVIVWMLVLFLKCVVF